MASVRRKLKNRRPPEGWELIEEVIEEFEQQMKDAVNEEHDGKRKAELTWKIHRIHWEKNRFIYDLMYQRKVMSKELVSRTHVPTRFTMPVLRADYCHTSVQFDYLCREKIADQALIAKWRKPGYEILCSMLAIQKGNHNFGTTSHCRVPMHLRANQQRITPDIQSGCISCASGDGKFGGPVWWNTPLEDEGGSAEENRTTWGQAGQSGPEEPAPSTRKNTTTAGKRPRDDFDPEEDEIPDEVQARLDALKWGVSAKKD
jgi:bud site selection protein 31